MQKYRNSSHKFHKSSRHHAKDKEFCPPEPEKHSTGTIYTIGALALVGGGTIGYAKYDPKFREWLKEQAPFTDDMIKVIFQEEKSLYASTVQMFGTIWQSVIVLFSSEEDARIKRDTILESKVDYKREIFIFISVYNK